MLRVIALTILSVLLWSCGQPKGSTNSEIPDPDWKLFQSSAVAESKFEGIPGYRPTEGKFLFRDLKAESDGDLSRRLLGAAGSRIAHVDRHKDRWQYYNDDGDAIESITLYTHPESWGSAYGICQTERYEIAFADDGMIQSISVDLRFGVEGPIFQKDNFDWDFYYDKMCEAVQANHTPSYFPAPDAVEAQDLAILLSKAIYDAGKAGPLPFRLSCVTKAVGQCPPETRSYLAQLRLAEIDETGEVNCDHADVAGQKCYTVVVGKNQLGPFPKWITIKGSTLDNRWLVYSVEVKDSFTIS